MGLNWIVFARRAVITNQAPHADGFPYTTAIDEWISELETHKRKLRELYYHQWPAEIQDLENFNRFDQRFQFTKNSIAAWKDHFIGADCAADPRRPHCRPRTAAAGGVGNSYYIPNLHFCVRLWKGPYRILKEQIDEDASTDWREVSRVSDNELRQNLMGEVENLGAVFYPGDVIEFPLFSVLHQMGVRDYARAIFNPIGSFLTGTSVAEMVFSEEPAGARTTGGQAEDTPTDIRRIDPLNFIFRDASGSTDPDDDSIRSVEFGWLGARVRSPGTILLHDNILAMRFQHLLNAALGSYYHDQPQFHDVSENLLENHVKEICGERIYSRGLIYGAQLGAINRRAPDQFHPAPCNRQQRRQNLQTNFFTLNDNNWGTSCLAVLDSIGRLQNPAKLTCAWVCSAATLSLSYFLVNTQWMFPPAGTVWDGMQPPPPVRRGRRQPPRRARERPLRAFGDSFSFDDQSARQPALRQLFGLQAATTDEDDGGEAEGEDVNIDSMVSPTQVREGNSVRSYPASEITVANFREFIGNGWCTIGTGTHEYAIICIFPHSKLAREGRCEVGPPITGYPAAYNPLSGEPYCSDDNGELYYFEATGILGTPRWFSNGIYRICEIKPFKWKHIDRFYIARELNLAPTLTTDEETGTERLAERPDARIRKFRFGDSSSPTSGIKEVCRFPLRNIQGAIRHRRPMAHRPISLYTGDAQVTQMFAHWNRLRSVPFPTAPEGEDGGYVTAETARQNVARYRQYLNGLLNGSNLSQAGLNAVRGIIGQECYTRETGTTNAFSEFVAYIQYLLTYLNTGSLSSGNAERNRLRNAHESAWNRRRQEAAQRRRQEAEQRRSREAAQPRRGNG
jgi:hypothetical protein